ncbi:hypothetical protein [Bacillus sp. FSL K6-3431]|uniref:hypothetical protein n=1 Tax=Bacillus sp. FSL K6-3431 TaxID=2921500 RepID=UPI0030F7BC86
MAKMTINGVTYEGTPEELREIVRTFEPAEAAAAETMEPTPTYRKVEGRKPRAGDYVKFDEDDADYNQTAGKYYEVTAVDEEGDLEFTDDADVDNVAVYGSDDFEVYEKVSANTPETISYKGANYTLVDRKAQPGDVVVFTETTGMWFENGKPYLVGENGEVTGTNRSSRVYREHLNRTEANVKVYAPVKAEAPKPNTGDIVVITANTNHSANKVGDIGKVEEAPFNGDKDVAVRVPGGRDTDAIYTLYSEMRLATPAEIKVYENAVAKAEFKNGDYARLKTARGSLSGFEVGDIVKVNTEYNGGSDFEVSKNNGRVFGYTDASNLEKVSAEEVAEITKWAAIGRKPNEYKIGDIIGYDSIKYRRVVMRAVTKVDGNRAYYYSPNFGEDSVNNNSDRLTLIAPVESRVDNV